MRLVWTIRTARCADAHFAVYPEELVMIPVNAGCPEGGTVLDPFLGSGTTAIVCERLKRSFLGIELNPEYVEIAKKRIREARKQSAHRLIGNAVPPPFMAAIAEHVRDEILGVANSEPHDWSAVHAAPEMPAAGEPEHGSPLNAPTVRGSMKRRNISKQTLSFSCSKAMKFLRTPADIWARLREEFDFSVDVCASHDNHLLPRYYTEAEDGLKQDWTGEVVWCHPMFDQYIGRWVEKAAESDCTTVMLMPASTHTKYFHEYIYHNPRCEVRFLRKPNRGFRFGPDDGTDDDPTTIGYIKPLMLVVFRNARERGDKAGGRPGRRLTSAGTTRDGAEHDI